jgi:hypothetical protein
MNQQKLRETERIETEARFLSRPHRFGRLNVELLASGSHLWHKWHGRISSQSDFFLLPILGSTTPKTLCNLSITEKQTTMKICGE